MNGVVRIYSDEESNDNFDVVSIFPLAMLDIVLKDELVDKSAMDLMDIYRRLVDMEYERLMDNESLDDRNNDNHHLVNQTLP
jgi:hypothetical protein